MKYLFLFSTVLLLLSLNLASAAHFIAGYVEDALDGTSPNGRSIRLWNPSNGQEIFGVVGPTGPSRTSNIYLIDCELLTTPCVEGDILNATLVDDNTGHIALFPVEVNVTTAGFDLMANISMNSPPTFINLTVEDIITSPENEIDLNPNATKDITCEGVLKEYDGISELDNVTTEFYSSTSFFGDTEDKNYNYKNSTCDVNTTYGDSTEAYVTCAMELEYFADAGAWDCTGLAFDNHSTSTNTTDSTTINTLLSIGLDLSINFSAIIPPNVTSEETLQVINLGNVAINLSLSGYGATEGDGNSMACDGPGFPNISVQGMKFNLTGSNPGNLTLGQTDLVYSNLTTIPQDHYFNLTSRQNDVASEANKSTYWRVHANDSISGICQGNVVIGATQN